MPARSFSSLLARSACTVDWACADIVESDMNVPFFRRPAIHWDTSSPARLATLMGREASMHAV
jgi:hypothetical protein